MAFESKFDIGERVYYWSVNSVRMLWGEISDISFYADKDGASSWLYGLSQVDVETDKPSFTRERIPEHLLFRERSDVLDFCMKLTENI